MQVAQLQHWSKIEFQSLKKRLPQEETKNPEDFQQTM